MSIDQWGVIIIILIAVILFITEWITVDLVGVIIISLLMVSGILTPGEAVKGFSNSATLTIMVMFALSAALVKTGQLNVIGNYLSQVLQESKTKGILGLMLFSGFISAFINNTPVVAVLIPIVLTASVKANISASKILIPLSFASIFGGVCTLIGTSTNILISSIAEEEGAHSFGMFEMTPIGIIFFVVGVVYLLAVGKKLIPDRESSTPLVQKYDLGKYLTDIQILPEAPSIGKKIFESPLITNLEVNIIGYRKKNQEEFSEPHNRIIIQSGDILRLSCSLEQIKAIQQREGVTILQGGVKNDKEFDQENYLLAEALVTPGSELEGKTISQTNFKQRYGATVLAIRSRSETFHTRLTRTSLHSGDILLLRGKKEIFSDFKNQGKINEYPFILISEAIENIVVNKKNVLFVFFIIVMVMMVSAFNILPILASAFIGLSLLVLFRSISMEDVYKAIDWKVIFLLSGTISLGIAMEKTGTAELAAGKFLSISGQWGPVVIISLLYLFTSILTELISNGATAILLTPIVISMAETMGIDSKPLLLTIMLAASASFMTPVGYQTNTMIYSAGNYRFSDFFRIGLPLNLIYWILATFLIPLFYL